MKLIEMKKEDLNKKFFENVLFFMIAEGGTMGEPGAIKFIRTDGNLFHLNYFSSDYKSTARGAIEKFEICDIIYP